VPPPTSSSSLPSQPSRRSSPTCSTSASGH
jgi:hypothetical protein